MLNALTIDVEDYFQVSAFEGCVSRESWGTYPSRVEMNTVRVLDILDEFGVTATFFILGWVAERTPALVKEIARRGHEVASHGYGHQRVCTQSRQEFRDDVRRSKAVLEDLAAAEVNGYRAPSYSISMDTLWAYDELLDAGYIYDSSVFPVRHDLYGIPDWPRYPFTVEKRGNGQWRPAATTNSDQWTANGDEGSAELADSWSAVPRSLSTLSEIPITTLSLWGRNIPIAGGGYFRFFPYTFTRWGLNRINLEEQRSFVFYLHPWEIDPEQPRMSGTSAKSRFRHYLNLDKTEKRFRRILQDFSFSSVQEVSRVLSTGSSFVVSAI